ncbi:protein NKG7-like [Rhinatrema bivittatum]|uniref:protein NKG7-like n=1 Tax=Rhinatrema bivittatum TaxID=194408 RepID=UPI001125CA02|nr:protein NKG7-like [Rhinatrema bivittatum]
MASLKLSGFILTVLSTFFLLVALASTNWGEGEGIHFGLWLACAATCQSTTSIAYGGYHAVRAFILIAFFLWVAILVLQAMDLWYNSTLPSVNKMKYAAHLSISAAILVFFGMAIFTGTYAPFAPKLRFGWSFGIGWFSAILGIAAATVNMLAFKKEPQ